MLLIVAIFSCKTITAKAVSIDDANWEKETMIIENKSVIQIKSFKNNMPHCFFDCFRSNKVINKKKKFNASDFVEEKEVALVNSLSSDKNNDNNERDE